MINKSPDKENLWWQPALQLFFELWGWLVIPIVAALFIGTWLDRELNTKPILFLVVTAIAFIITIYGIIKRSLNVLKRMKIKEQEKPDQRQR